MELQDILREERPCCFTALSLLLLQAAVQGAFGGEDARQYTRGHDGPDSEDERTDDDNGNEYRVRSMIGLCAASTTLLQHYTAFVCSTY